MIDHQLALAEMISNRGKRLNGQLTCIPWKNFPKFNRQIPGIEESTYCIVSANSKVGKTQITDCLYLYEPIDYLYKNPDSLIQANILYFSLEISKKAKSLYIIANRLYSRFGIEIDPQNLLSKYEEYILPENIAQIVSDDHEYYEFLYSRLTVIDEIKNPYGIFKYCKDYFLKNGTVEEADYSIDGENIKGIKSYTPNDPNLITIIIIDNYNNLQPEKGGTLFDAIHKFSSDYALDLKNKFRACMVAVQQQAAASEKQDFNNKGELITTKLRPTADGLGDCKLSGRDVDYLIGLFAPHRYSITTWNGYNLKILDDNYRELSIIFNRHGSGSQSDSLYFNGKVNYFKELPNVGSPELNKLYDNLKIKNK